MPTAAGNKFNQSVSQDSQPPTKSMVVRSRSHRINYVNSICGSIVVASLLACLVMAAQRSMGLIQVTVTAIDRTAEPRDHNLPLLRRKEALPDYEIVLILANGGKVRLGAKPDTSAAEGLTWQVADPVSTADIASVRLQEQDVVLSDALAEVQIGPKPATASGYRFEFVTQASFAVGVRSFFGTPIGVAIFVGFILAVLVVVLQKLRSVFSSVNLEDLV